MTSAWSILGISSYWLIWPLLWVYLRRSQRTRILIICGDEILVTRTWLSDGRWSLPGGGLHSGEEPLAGVIREVSEETGIKLSAARTTYLISEPYKNRGLSFVCHYFLHKLHEKPDIHLQRFEISASRWVQIDQVTSRHYGMDVQRSLQLLGTKIVK